MKEIAYNYCQSGGQVLLLGSSFGKRILQEAFGWARCSLVLDRHQRGWSTMFDGLMAGLFLGLRSQTLVLNVSCRFDSGKKKTKRGLEA